MIAVVVSLAGLFFVGAGLAIAIGFDLYRERHR